MIDRTVTVSRVINAPIERVWRAWTNPNAIKHWFIAKPGLPTEVIQFDVKVGGKVRLKFPGAAGEYTWTYVKIDEPNLLMIDILDYSLPEFLPDGVGGISNIGFKDLNGKTEITVGGELPDGMNNEKSRKMAENGWSFTLDNLNNYVKEK
ncbi:MAG TPA: SRPBCC domain-containing protein [Candidatus Saccharimonadales bacterium]|nr:SRPBCC domain-containing protein [Candidatus Saccharimonadales bacterium]